MENHDNRTGPRAARARLRIPFNPHPSTPLLVLRVLEVIVDELRHLEHRDLSSAAKYSAQPVVGIDHPTVLLILETILPDVIPNPFRHLGTRHRPSADDSSKVIRRLHGPHERRIRRALGALRSAALRRGTTPTRLASSHLLPPSLLRAAAFRGSLPTALSGSHALSPREERSWFHPETAGPSRRKV